MAPLIGFALMAPWLLVLAGAYWWYAKRHHLAAPALRWFDAFALSVATAAALFGAFFGYALAADHGGAIWKHVIAALGAWCGFNLVLFFGLCRHWWLPRAR